MKKIDIGEYSHVKAGPITFDIECYDLENIGRLSFMKGKAMLGLMKMDTLMFVPLYNDSPLFSYDRIKVMGNDTLIIEMYDTFKDAHPYPELQKIKNNYSSFKNHELKPNWYDSIRLKESISIKDRKKSKEIDELFSAYLSKFLDLVKKDNPIGVNEKKKLQAKYVDGLLNNGGPSTDAFVKAIGIEKTTILFKKYLFGVE